MRVVIVVVGIVVMGVRIDMVVVVVGMVIVGGVGMREFALVMRVIMTGMIMPVMVVASSCRRGSVPCSCCATFWATARAR